MLIIWEWCLYERCASHTQWMNEANECEWGTIGWTLVVSRDGVSIPCLTLPKRWNEWKGELCGEQSLWIEMKCLIATALSPKSFLR